VPEAGVTGLQSEIRNPKPETRLPPRAVVVTFDRLHLGYLGCYGNDWIETPHLDRLATRAVVFDRHCSENLDPLAANHGWWNGIYQFALDAEQQRRCPSFLDELHACSVKTHLIIESDSHEDTTIAPPFGQVSTVRGADGFDVSEGETPFARTVKRCTELLDESVHDSAAALLWVKSRGVPVPWIPPREFAELYLDDFGLGACGDEDDESENDVPGIESDGFVDNENLANQDSGDSAPQASVDESLDWRYAAAMYAAYVTLLDRWLGRLLAAIDQSPVWNGALLIVTAGCGQALGEHGGLTDERIKLRAECLHTPLLILLPEGDQAGTRRAALVQTVDLAPTLLEWFCRSTEACQTIEPAGPINGQSLLTQVRGEEMSQRDRILMGSGRSEWGILTNDFFYVESGDRNHDSNCHPPMLFQKPHDVWDQFDMLSQFPQVSEELRRTLHQQIEQLSAPRPIGI
jgi:arylsulfatase A-like enzyme